MSKFTDFLNRKCQQYPTNFDASDLNPDFIEAFNCGNRITVDFGYEKKRGTIGVTTGWKPVFLLMLTKRSISSFYTISKTDRIVG